MNAEERVEGADRIEPAAGLAGDEALERGAQDGHTLVVDAGDPRHRGFGIGERLELGDARRSESVEVSSGDRLMALEHGDILAQQACRG